MSGQKKIPSPSTPQQQSMMNCDMYNNSSNIPSNNSNETSNANPRVSQEQSFVKKLFVANLREYFQRFGNIVDVQIMKDQFGTPRGFAYVTFDDCDAVNKVLREQVHIVDGRDSDVKVAVPKEQTNNQKQNYNHNTRIHGRSNGNYYGSRWTPYRLRGGRGHSRDEGGNHPMQREGRGAEGTGGGKKLLIITL